MNENPRRVFSESFCPTLISTVYCLHDLYSLSFNVFVYLEQKLNHKCAMIYSQDMNMLDKNYNLFSSVKSLCFNFVLTFFVVSTIKSLWGHHLGVMPVSIPQWRVEIGIFHTRFSRVSKSRSTLLYNYCTIAFYFVCYMALTLFICDDVELNPGHKNTKSYHFSLRYWNLNSLLTHDFSKLSLIEAYNTHHNFDMICHSETYLFFLCRWWYTT